VVFSTPEFVVVGHVCRDIVADVPGWRPGGAAFYAAAAAAKLGYTVGVLTAGASEVQALEALPNTMVVSLDAKKSTTYENIYEAGVRQQYVRAVAPLLPVDLVPPEWIRAPVVLLAPVAGEVPPSMVRMFPRSLLGISLQGYLRRCDADGAVSYQPWQHASEMLPYAAAVIFSDEDMHGHHTPWLRDRGPLIVETRGQLGCELTHHGKMRTVPGFPAAEADATGAGDVFAAAFLLELARVREPLQAARYANCVASFAVEGIGIDALPSASQVKERLESWTSS